MPGSTYIKAKKARHTSTSPTSLPYTPVPNAAPNPPTLRPSLPSRLPYTPVPNTPTPPSPPTLHLPTHLPYTSPASKCYLQRPRRPYPSQPTLQPAPSNNPSPPSPDRLPYTHSGTAHKMRRPRQRLPRRLPLPKQRADSSSPRSAYPIPAPAQTSRNHAQVPARKSVQVLQLFNHTSHLPVRPPSSVASGLSLGNLGEEGLTLSRS